MPLILTSRTPWRRRPSGLVEIDRSSPQASGLVACHAWQRDLGVRDVVLGNHATTLVGAPTWGQSVHGDALTFPGTGDVRAYTATLSPGLPYRAADEFTLHAVFYVSSVVALSTIYGFGDPTVNGAAGTQRRIMHYLGNYRFWGESSDWDTGVSVVTGSWDWITITRRGSSGVLYRNGALAASGSISLVTNANTGIVVGGRHSSGNAPNGSFLEGRIYNRALSASEVWQLYAPDTRWSLYVPLVRRIYFSLGGGSTFNESLTYAAATALAQAATAAAASTAAYAAATAMTPAPAATGQATTGYSATTALAQAGSATAAAATAYAAASALAQAATAAGNASAGYSAATVLGQAGAASAAASTSYAATAAQSYAVTCLASLSVALSAITALDMSDGSTQNVSESVGYSATAAHAMAASAVADAVQAYLASAGLTHANAATAGAALAVSASAALSHSVTGQASALIILSAATNLLMTAQANGDISYAVLHAAAETLRAALATSNTITDATVASEEWHN